MGWPLIAVADATVPSCRIESSSSTSPPICACLASGGYTGVANLVNTTPVSCVAALVVLWAALLSTSALADNTSTAPVRAEKKDRLMPEILFLAEHLRLPEYFPRQPCERHPPQALVRNPLPANPC